jgi:outer membrane receptor protein involved in Fe transport
LAEAGATDSAEPKEGDSAGLRLEEVLVTAQKREERLQDVPISISVLSGESLDSAPGAGMTDQLARVPGISINAGQGVSQIQMRGVAAGNPTFVGASAVAYYLDSIPFGFSKTALAPDPDVYDLDRVEVLRGPQGTLYGASALNGVVRVLTNEADPHAFELKGRSSISSTRGGGENYRGDLAINVPIVAEKLAARVVLGYQDLSGWVDKGNDENANDGERSNIRFRLNGRPSEQLSVGLSAWLSRSDYAALAVAADQQRRADSFREEPNSVDFDAYGLQVGYEAPLVSISSMTSYLDYSNDSVLDRPPLHGTLEINLPARTFSQELLFRSAQPGLWRWSGGAMYRDGQDRLGYFIEGFNVVPYLDMITSKSYALFGELSRSLWDGQLELTAGLRNFKDDVELNELSRANGDQSHLITHKATFSATTPRLVATWHPGAQMTLYASYAEGFRSGAVQGPSILSVVPDFPQADPDSLKNYEVGMKGGLLEGRLNFEAAAFYMDWQDVQQQLLVTLNNFVFNAVINSESASGMGAEVAISALPTDGLQFGLNFSWNDLTFDNGVMSGTTLLYEKGDRLNFSPEYTAGATADYSFGIGSSGLEMRLSAAASYTAATRFTLLDAGSRRTRQNDDLLMTRASLSLRSPRHWTATLFAENLNNEHGAQGRVFAFDENLSVRVRPRTIGLQLEYRN